MSSKKKDVKIALLEDRDLTWSVSTTDDGAWHDDGKITGARIEAGADVAYVVNNLLKKIGTEHKILAYCIDRVLRYHKIYDASNYEARTRPDYYGETVEAEVANWSYLAEINDDLKKLYALNDNERIEFVLTQEYGYVLPHIKDRQWYVQTTPTSRIEVTNENYMTKLQKEDKEIYNDKYKLPIGIYKPIYDSEALTHSIPKYRIIDGYHRYVVFANKKEVEIITYVH